MIFSFAILARFAEGAVSQKRHLTAKFVSRFRQLDCQIVEESTTEDESENEEPPQSAEFGIQRRATNRLWPPHTPRSGKKEGRGRGKQVSFLCSRWG